MIGKKSQNLYISNAWGHGQQLFPYVHLHYGWHATMKRSRSNITLSIILRFGMASVLLAL